MHAAHMWYENKIYSSNTNEDIYNPEKTRRVSVKLYTTEYCWYIPNTIEVNGMKKA